MHTFIFVYVRFPNFFHRVLDPCLRSLYLTQNAFQLLCLLPLLVYQTFNGRLSNLEILKVLVQTLEKICLDLRKQLPNHFLDSGKHLGKSLLKLIPGLKFDRLGDVHL